MTQPPTHDGDQIAFGDDKVPDPWLNERVPNAPAAARTDRGASDDALARVANSFLREQRLARRWRVFFRLVWFVLVAAVVWFLFARSPVGVHTAVIDVNGEIGADATANAADIIAALRTAFEATEAKAVVLRINSPGGSPVQAGMINDEIGRLKAKHHKPIYAVVEDTCASGAYYIAVATDQIFVDKASIVGSIGVLMNGFGFTGAMEKMGVERRLLTAGENKGILDPFSPLDDKQRLFVQGMLDQIHQQFITVVKEGRGDRLKSDTPELFSGLFWTGEQAISLGLADKVGSVDFVAREVVKEEAQVDYTHRENVADRLVKRFGASLGTGVVEAMRTFATTLH